MNEKKLIADQDRCWKYYKCDNCGHADRYNNLKHQQPPVICSVCGNMIRFDQKKEDEWLYAVDENGQRKRHDFAGFSEKKCRERAAKYFGCGEHDFDYYIVRVAGQGGNCIINATRPVKYVLKKGDIRLDMLKLGGHVSSWCVINPDNMTFLVHTDTDDKMIHFDGVKAINFHGNTCEVEFLPSGKFLLTFVLDCFKNMNRLYDILEKYLSHYTEKVGVLTVENAREVDIAYQASSKRCYFDFKYIDLDLKGGFDAWKTETDLCFLHSHKIYRIPLDEIKYYRLIGQKYYASEVSGGGGGGSSIKGAVVGGVIAGGAGAVIGSRKKIDEVHSTDKVHDEREMLLYFKNDDQVAHMEPSAYDFFIDMIPDKDYEIFSAEKSTEGSDAKSELKMLEQLDDLCKKGIITEEEFNEKKKEILSRI